MTIPSSRAVSPDESGASVIGRTSSGASGSGSAEGGNRVPQSAVTSDRGPVAAPSTRRVRGPSRRDLVGDRRVERDLEHHLSGALRKTQRTHRRDGRRRLRLGCELRRPGQGQRLPGAGARRCRQRLRGGDDQGRTRRVRLERDRPHDRALGGQHGEEEPGAHADGGPTRAKMSQSRSATTPAVCTRTSRLCRVVACGRVRRAEAQEEGGQVEEDDRRPRREAVRHQAVRQVQAVAHVDGPALAEAHGHHHRRVDERHRQHDHRHHAPGRASRTRARRSARAGSATPSRSRRRGCRSRPGTRAPGASCRRGSRAGRP